MVVVNHGPASDETSGRPVHIIHPPNPTHPDERVPVGAARVREDGETEVVPVDDERRPAQARREPGDGERGDAGRVLHENELGAG